MQEQIGLEISKCTKPSDKLSSLGIDFFDKILEIIAIHFVLNFNDSLFSVILTNFVFPSQLSYANVYATKEDYENDRKAEQERVEKMLDRIATEKKVPGADILSEKNGKISSAFISLFVHGIFFFFFQQVRSTKLVWTRSGIGHVPTATSLVQRQKLSHKSVFLIRHQGTSVGSSACLYNGQQRVSG